MQKGTKKSQGCGAHDSYRGKKFLAVPWASALGYAGLSGLSGFVGEEVDAGYEITSSGLA